MIFNRHIYRKEAEDGEDGGGGETVETDENADKAAAETDEASKEPEVSADVIAEAEKMGWTPKDKFRGDPAKWRPADEFVERGKSMLPIVQAQVKRQEREIANLKSGIKELTEYHSKSEQRAFERALLSLREQRAEAIKNGDGVAFDKVDGEIEQMRENIAKAKPAEKGEEADPVFEEWLSRNKWAEDPKLQAYGAAMGKYLQESGETATGMELLDLVTKEVKAKFPEKFENPRRNSAPAVEGGAGPRRSAGKSYADLPAEARAACDRMARNGYADKPKEMAAFKAEYTRNYFEE